VASQQAPVGDADDETDADLVAALDELSAEDREIVRLWAWEQLAPREIAVVLAISPNAASIRLHRAKRRLADRLGKDGAAAGHNPAGDQAGRTEEGA
jgi:RNA polymerase sigma-70 factor (ECF subfamily)